MVLVASKSIRDSQRERVYRSERKVYYGVEDKPRIRDVTPDFKTVAECQAYVDYVTDSNAWIAMDVYQLNSIEVLDGRGRRRAGAIVEFDQITLPKWTRSKYQILHELAHIAVGLDESYASHGPEFTGIYLYLVHEFLGPEVHDKMVEAFETNKVKVLHHDKHTREVVSVTDTDTQTPQCLECDMVLSHRHRFCSDRCRWTYHNRRRHQRTAADRERVCEVCGNEFTATRRDAKTCSAACKQRAYRQRART